jgi:hypothetical protein
MLRIAIRDVCLPLWDGGYAVFDHPTEAAHGTQRVGDRKITVLRNSLHPLAEEHLWCDLAGSVCGAAGRRNGTSSGVCTRHPAHGSLGACAFAAVGALSTLIFLAHHPIRVRAGQRMFAAVIIFGVATVAFALSKNVWLSMAILSVLGAADVTSVVVRSSLVQMETPDEMRGRVSAVNSLFIGTSNQLGEFESGVTASWFGIIPATIIGGVGSVFVALIWMGLFPGLRKLESVARHRQQARRHRLRMNVLKDTVHRPGHRLRIVS